MRKEEEREAYWRGHVDDWRASGETQRAYCERLGLKAPLLSYWQLRLPARKATEAVSAAVPLTLVRAVVSPETAPPASRMSLHSPGGWRAEFSALPPAAWLAELWGGGS